LRAVFFGVNNIYMFRVRQLVPVFALFIVLVVTFWVYRPGLTGGFLFDDYPNLKELGTYGGVRDFETFKNFVFNGIASPLGRPLALSSFLIDDNNWPSQGQWFKPTNVKIHLLCGLALCWATLNLLRIFKRPEEDAIWIALLSSAIWLLHPYMVSTTLYIVQRMAQLAALFVFAGLAGYFHGRLLLINARIKEGYIWMSVSLGLASFLALLCKENGVLLPMLVLAIEYCFPNGVVKLNRWWAAVFLWLPSIVVICLLAKKIDFSPDAWPNRPFTQPERLLTEPRIIWEYLYHLYIPQIESRGLFQDGYNFSRSFLNPISTIFAIIALGILILVAWLVRARFPLFSIAIFFYLVGHLLESTVIALELYFEHRNYMTSAFLFLPIATILVDSKIKYSVWISIVGAVLLIAALSFLTWKRAQLWSNTTRLEIYWAASTPESPRAQNKIAAFMLEQGRVEESIKFIEDAAARLSDSSLLSVNELLIKIYTKVATEEDFKLAAHRISVQPFDAQAVVGLRSIVDKTVLSDSNDKYKRYTLNLLNEVESCESYVKFYQFNKLIPYLKAQTFLALGEYDSAYDQYSKAMDMYKDTDSALSMVAEMANAERPVEAAMLFKQAEVILKNQPDKTLRRSRALYNFEFKRIEAMLIENLAAIGIKWTNGAELPKDGKINNDQHTYSSQK